jgi:hypothetical protein
MPPEVDEAQGILEKEQRMKRVTVWTNVLGIGLGLGVALSAAPAARAQYGQNAKEAVQNEREIRVDKAQLAGDVADVRALERELALLDRAQAAGKSREEDRIRQRIHVLLRKETAEARRDLAQDKREVAKSAQELRAERREVGRDTRELRQDRATGSAADVRDSKKDLRKDVRDLRDDRRDLRDDARDAAASASRLDRQKAILRELREIQPGVKQRKLDAMSRERALFDEFLRISKEDALATGRELIEDRGERREDRRERRDDRQERREGRR